MITSAVLDHVATVEPDIDSAVTRHVELLGFRLLRWGRHIATGRRIAMLADTSGSKVELIEIDAGAGVEEARRQLAHVAYRTGDVDRLHAVLLAAGFAELRPPGRLEPARARTSLLRDPAGAQLQLISYDPDSPDLVTA
jgi:Glyoxalase/Bleomycin resistance protein/Dioxygenase superfamily